jgi:hypothetical protein
MLVARRSSISFTLRGDGKLITIISARTMHRKERRPGRLRLAPSAYRLTSAFTAPYVLAEAGFPTGFACGVLSIFAIRRPIYRRRAQFLRQGPAKISRCSASMRPCRAARRFNRTIRWSSKLRICKFPGIGRHDEIEITRNFDVTRFVSTIAT